MITTNIINNDILDSIYIVTTKNIIFQVPLGNLDGEKSRKLLADHL